MHRASLKCIMVCAFIILFQAPSARAADDFSGRYEGAGLSLSLNAGEGGYLGQIQLGQQTFPLRARDASGQLAGSFASDGNNFDFTASLDGDTLTLISGGQTHRLKKLNANPLAQLPSAVPAQAPAASVADALSGYTVVATTDFGKTLTIVRPNADSVSKAFAATFPDLARFFGVRPTIQGAYEDTKIHRGTAAFVAKVGDQPIKGLVACNIGQSGANITLVYCRADTPKAEWDKLNKASPAGAAAQVPLNEYQFPDGTGSIGLADGWTTHAQSCMTGVDIAGPADQHVYLALCVSASTPDSMVVRMQRDNEARARQFSLPPPPKMPILVAPMTSPADALVALAPQFSAMGEKNGLPPYRLDRIVKQEKTAAFMQGGQAALITFDLTQPFHGQPRQYRGVAQIEIDPIGQDAFMFYIAAEGLAPKDTFERDVPAMLAIAGSLKTNDQVVSAKAAAALQNQRQWFDAQQKAHQQRTAAFDGYMKTIKHNELVADRNFANMDEIIVGYRTVEDTATGNRTSVDLGNVHEIVNKLNESDPGRYKEIPLRDEMYPLPGH